MAVNAITLKELRESILLDILLHQLRTLILQKTKS